LSVCAAIRAGGQTRGYLRRFATFYSFIRGLQVQPAHPFFAVFKVSACSARLQAGTVLASTMSA
jgi:hypothetical protein